MTFADPKISETLTVAASVDKRCSDFDSDCNKVKDPLRCWIGGERICSNGAIAVMPLADGYCPLLRKPK